MASVSYDSEADALYVTLGDGPSVRTDELGDGRMIDYDSAGVMIGFELIGVSHREINLDGVPRADEIAAALRAIPHPV